MTDRKAPTILVVDDEIMIALSVAEHLADEGFHVLVAHDGRQALDMARDERPDAVVTDHMMPRMSGLEFALELRKDAALSRVPVVLTSAVPPGNPDSVFTEVFSKPFQLSELTALLRKLVGPVS